ncbi:MAG: aldehyde ferredoxin oxidoreductase family protein, partial [Candidatus Ranarchaeia archaeon]
GGTSAPDMPVPKYPFWKGGYTGRILRVNLSTGEIKKEPLDPAFAWNYLGGTGFVAKILWDETDRDTDPLGPGNVFVVAPGFNAGAVYTGSGRCTVGAKSPLTGGYGDANFGGKFSSELHYAGYDAIIVNGASKTPVYLWIDDDNVEIRDASAIWGKNTWDTAEMLEKEVGDPTIQYLTIGQAGENMVRYAGVMHYWCRAAGRSGMGAVLGSKKLKAIAVRGTKGHVVAKPDEYFKLYLDYRGKVDNDPFTVNNTKYGTMLLVQAMNEIGRFPTYNHREGQFPAVEKIDGDYFVDHFKTRDWACMGCQVACKGQARIVYGKHEGRGELPEYETIDGFAANVGSDDAELALYCGWLCEQYGLDTISTSGCIAFAMELWEKGIITEEDTKGLDLSWGNKETIEKLVHMIAHREGFGDLLAEGTRIAAQKIGRGAEYYAIHVKGQEIAAQDGRAQAAMAVAHATSVRGADHLKHCCFYDEVGFPEPIKLRWGDEFLPEMMDRQVYKYKGRMAKDLETVAVIVNTYQFCVSSGAFWPPLLWWDMAAKMYDAVIGVERTEQDLKAACERIVQLRKAYNLRLGWARDKDTLPARMTTEAADSGPTKGIVVPLEDLLDSYYWHWEWTKDGKIPRENFEKVGLGDVADELEKIGMLGKEEDRIQGVPKLM